MNIKKASEYKNDYIITLILNLNDIPQILTIENPIKNLILRKNNKSKSYKRISFIKTNMLTFENKIEIFTSILSQEENSYADSFNGEILIFGENFDFKFFG